MVQMNLVVSATTAPTVPPFGGQDMIQTRRDINHLATCIADAAFGSCEWCRKKIGRGFCAPAQILLEGPALDTTKGIELRYEIICKRCHGKLKAEMDRLRVELSTL